MTLEAGPFLPSVAINSDEIGTFPWLNPTNVTIDNLSVSLQEAYQVGYSNYLKVSDFGFAIPTGAIIEGIVFDVSIYAVGETDTLPKFRRIKIIKGNGDLGTDDKVNDTTGLSIPAAYISDYNSDLLQIDGRQVGGVDDLWEEEWTAEDINSANFGLAIQIIKTDGQPVARNIKATVYYHEAE